MGDRAIAVFSEREEIQAYAVYFHWAGKDGLEAIYKDCLEAHSARRDDISYFSARFVQMACALSSGSTGVDLLAGPTKDELKDMATYSHGDAGVAILEPETGSIKWIEGTGYGATA